MQPGGHNPRANSNPSGRYGNHGSGNGEGFRYGRDQSYHPPAPPSQMTPREQEEALLAAGRLAAEYLVARGDLPPDVLENRPPAPLPFRRAPPVRRHPTAPPRPFFHSFQGQARPFAPQRRWHQGPRPFQGGPGPFAKRPRPSPYGPRGLVPPWKRYAGQGAAGPVGKMQQESAGSSAVPAGETSESQPSGVGSGEQQGNQPSSDDAPGANGTSN
ncbi:hypothetical protein ACP70R_026561 [Stipagrostis hirtigluma subsp. patula]